MDGLTTGIALMQRFSISKEVQTGFQNRHPDPIYAFLHHTVSNAAYNRPGKAVLCLSALMAARRAELPK